MVFLILFTLLGTALGQSQLAAITYLDEGTCNLDSDVNVELWVNSAPDVCKLTNLVVNAETSLTMNKLTLNEIESAQSQLQTIKSTYISPIDSVLDVTTTKLETKELDVVVDNINYLNVGIFDNDIYVKTDGGVQTTGLRITKDGEDPLNLDYETIKRLIALLL
tara:strand:- start:326 stop:817 length:492 start_codon:yes stop_codon:yes gene_type:complete